MGELLVPGFGVSDALLLGMFVVSSIRDMGSSSIYLPIATSGFRSDECGGGRIFDFGIAVAGNQ